MLAVLTIVSGFQIATRLRPHFVHFEPGEEVYRLNDGERFGVIQAFEKSHEFPNGARQDAYQIKLHPDWKSAWISARTARTALTTDP